MFLPGQWYEFLCFVVECSLCFWFTWNRWSFLRFLQGHIRSPPPPRNSNLCWYAYICKRRNFAFNIFYWYTWSSHCLYCIGTRIIGNKPFKLSVGSSWLILTSFARIPSFFFSMGLDSNVSNMSADSLFFSRASSFNFYWQIRQKLLTHL